MRIIFVSYDLDGYFCLDKILKMGANVVGIFTLKEEKLEMMCNTASFDNLAEDFDIPLFKVDFVNNNIDKIKDLNPDLIFVLGWSELINDDILRIPEKGCVGVHPTMLPQHRGRAPIPWTLIKGLKKSGITLFYIDQGTDSGDIILQKEFDVNLEDDAESLTKKVSKLQIEMVGEVFPLLIADKAPRIKQDSKSSDYWPKRTPEDGMISWEKSAFEIYNLVRGVSHPYPGAFTFLNGERIYIWKSFFIDNSSLGIPGMVNSITKQGIEVFCKKGKILITSVQMGNNPELNALEFVNEYSVKKGSKFGGLE